MKSTTENDNLIIFLSKRIDSENAAEIDEEIGKIIAEHPNLNPVFDAENLEYISSVGLRVILKYRKMAKDTLIVRNVSKEVYDIFEMTGFTKLLTVRRKLRNISIDGCAQVGTGLSSKVYRIDPENIVKVYDLKVPLYKIEREIDLAKKAFVAGLPTAISYDLVKVGEAYGVVFEMIADAVNVGDALSADNGKNFDAIMKKFAALMKTMHSTPVNPSDGFPSIKGTWEDWAKGMRQFYDDAEYFMLRKIISAVPERNTIVHCDFHAGNTLYQNGEIVVIDMADVGFSHPVFDFAAGAFHAMVSDDKEGIQKSLSLSQENILRFWDTLLRNYFETADENKIAEIKNIFKAFALLRGALFPMKHVQIPQARKEFFVNSARKNFFPNFDWAMEQAAKLDEIF